MLLRGNSRRLRRPQAASGGGGGAPTDGDADFAYRSNYPGVVRVADFADSSALGTFYDGSFASFSIDTGHQHSGDDHVTVPVVDTTKFASGVGSLKFAIPGTPPPVSYDKTDGVYGDRCGVWWMNFSSNGSVRYGDNREFFVQARAYWDNALMTNFYQATLGNNGGIKFFDVVSGDIGSDKFTTSSSLKVVVTTQEYSNVIITYSYDRAGNNQFLSESNAFSDNILQNGPGLGILYSTQSNLNDIHKSVPYERYTCGSSACEMVGEEWVTLMLGVSLGPRVIDGGSGQYVYSHSRVRLWFAREGEAPQLVNDFNEDIFGGYFEITAKDAIASDVLTDSPATSGQLKFGKVNFFPYMTEARSDPSGADQVDAAAWYDEIIVGQHPLPFPGGFHIDSQNSTLQANLAANTVYQIGTFAPVTSGSGYPSDGARIFEYGAAVIDLNRRRIVLLGGGHQSTNYDSIAYMSLDTFAITEEYLPIKIVDMTPGNFNSTTMGWTANVSGTSSGPFPRPVARHTYGNVVVWGNEILMLGGCNGNQEPLGSGWSDPHDLHNVNGTGVIWHYNLFTQVWTPTSAEADDGENCYCVDPASDLVWGVSFPVGGSSGGIWTYNPTTQTRTCVVDLLSDGSHLTKESGGLENTDKVAGSGALVYRTKTKKLYFFGNATNGFTPRVFRLDLDRATPSNTMMVSLTYTGTMPTPETHWAYDSKNDLFIGGAHNGTMWTFDPTTQVFSSAAMTGNTGAESMDLAHTACYDPVNECVIWINCLTQKIHAYRKQ